MARKKKHEEHANHERWVISYADLVTLLFALFVVLYATSQVDARKMKQFADSVQFAFHFEGTGRTFERGVLSGQQVTSNPGGSGLVGSVAAAVPRTDFHQHMVLLETNLNGLMRKLGSGSFHIARDRTQFAISLPSSTLFLPSATKLSAAGEAVIAEIARVIGSRQYPLLLQGYFAVGSNAAGGVVSSSRVLDARLWSIREVLRSQHAIEEQRITTTLIPLQLEKGKPLEGSDPLDQDARITITITS